MAVLQMRLELSETYEHEMQNDMVGRVAERNTDCMGRMRLVLLEEESKHRKEGSDVEGISKAVQVMVLAPAMARVWILKR